MNDLLGRVASVLERRFLLVSFLPALIFSGGLTLLTTLASGTLGRNLTLWGTLPASVQFGLLLGFLAAVWLAAGFLDSQLRNVVKLFEGYPLTKVLPGIASRASEWHRIQRDRISTRSRQVVMEPMAPELIAKLHAAGSPKALSGAKSEQDKNNPPTRRRGGFRDEPYILYSRDADWVLPTRLGNIIRAAEEYSLERYRSDYLKIWPRLAHLCSDRFFQEYEATRSSVDFLLVICLLSALFGLVGGVIQIIFTISPLVFLVTITGSFLLSHLSYSSAVEAAKDYGEHMRASMDLFRLELLKQLRYPEPQNIDEEMSSWDEFESFFRGGPRRRSSYVNPPTGGSDASA